MRPIRIAVQFHPQHGDYAVLRRQLAVAEEAGADVADVAMDMPAAANNQDDRGSKPTLVFMHGLGDTASGWYGLVAHFLLEFC